MGLLTWIGYVGEIHQDAHDVTRLGDNIKILKADGHLVRSIS